MISFTFCPMRRESSTCMFVDPVGVVHFLDGFLAPDLRHVQKIPKEAVMRPILVDGRELMSQGRV
jgi:hypothetical protein